MVLAMQGNATIRMLLAILGVAFLLANPAGVCAGMMASDPAPDSHSCCPKPSAESAKAPCICIDRQPAAQTLPAPGEQAQVAATDSAALPIAEIPVAAAEFLVSEDPYPAPGSILLSIHQLLL